MPSKTVASPIRYPVRIRSSRKGVRLMFSWPPATTTSALPSMICSAATWTALVPDPQAMLTVKAGFSSPSPDR